MQTTSTPRWGRLLAWISLILGCVAVIAALVGVLLQRPILLLSFTLLIGLGSIASSVTKLLPLHQPRVSLIGSMIGVICTVGAIIVFFLYILNPH